MSLIISAAQAGIHVSYHQCGMANYVVHKKLEYMSLIIKTAQKKRTKKKGVAIKPHPHWYNVMFICVLDVHALGSSAPSESGSRYCAVLHSACGLGIACEKC